MQSAKKPITVHFLCQELTEERKQADSHKLPLKYELELLEGYKLLEQYVKNCGYETCINFLSLDNMAEKLTQLKLNNDINSMIFFNLCEGTDDGEGGDGYPGISLVRLLQEMGLNYTGSNEYFYNCSTSKVLIKEALLTNGVATSAYVEINKSTIDQDVRKAVEQVGFPLFVKLSCSQASIGISRKSICRTFEEAVLQCQEIFKLDVSKAGVFIESFLPGREFTVLIAGDKQRGTKIYLPAERVFNESLENDQKILDFDSYWIGYGIHENEKIPEEKDCLYKYCAAPEEAVDMLKNLARDAYLAMGGTGYGRADIRTNLRDLKDPNCKAFILEVNAQPGFSFDPLTTSMGAILALEKIEPFEFIQTVIEYANGPSSQTL